jgi:pimeloyl-ACP methyl ester carboxylesterase
MSSISAQCALAASLICLFSCERQPLSAQFQEKTCAEDLQRVGARCGTVSVPENYAHPDRRRIDLNVVVLSALEDAELKEAQFEIDGGPGVAVTGAASFYATDGAMYRRRRDIVMADLRGAGLSHPLRCGEIEIYDAGDPWRPIYPSDLVERCAADLRKSADLSQYTTTTAARDLESVRVSLGYDRVVLNALSYGTTLAAEYMRHYPKRVTAAALTGPVPPSRTPPRYHAEAAEKAFARLSEACVRDAACAAAFSDPAEDFRRAREAADAHMDGGGEIFAERVRRRMYSAADARALFSDLKAAASGDFSRLMTASAAGPGIADGPYLSITCAESFPHFNLEEARAASRKTKFGDYRLRRQATACEEWNVQPSSSSLPKRSQIPVLLITGEFDPVAEPEWSQEFLTAFPRGRQLTLPGGGHILDGMSDLDTCFDPLVVRFFDEKDAQRIDADCVKRMTPPNFILPQSAVR